MKHFFGVLFTVLTVTAFSQHKYDASWASIDSRPVPSWFEDAKFGIFLHWGLYSVPAWGPTDGSIYEKYAEWYWNRLMQPETSTGKKFNDFHNKVYSEKFQYQDFVSGFKAEMFEPDEWAEIFKDAGARYVVLTSKHLIQQQRLRDMGSWLRINGEGIYGTRVWSDAPADNPSSYAWVYKISGVL